MKRHRLSATLASIGLPCHSRRITLDLLLRRYARVNDGGFLFLLSCIGSHADVGTAAVCPVVTNPFWIRCRLSRLRLAHLLLRSGAVHGWPSRRRICLSLNSMAISL